MARVIICRHGNTFDKGDVVRRVGARTDLSLSKSGIKQAKFLAEQFTPLKSGYNFSRAYCSPLQRTQSTCSYILSSGHTAVAPNFLNFLIEIDYGPDENKPESDVIERIGKKAIKLWNTSGTPPQGWLVDPDQIISSWKLFLKNMSDTNDDILVVTSNGIARFLFEAVDNIEIDIHRKLDTACFGLVNVDQDITSLKVWNRKCIR
jgi:probable phosphoglycerate mutase